MRSLAPDFVVSRGDYAGGVIVRSWYEKCSGRRRKTVEPRELAEQDYTRSRERVRRMSYEDGF